MLACGLLVALVGCGGGSQAPKAVEAIDVGPSIHEVEDWVAQLERTEGDVPIAHFSDHPDLPLPPLNLATVRRLNAPATLAASNVQFDAGRLANVSNLSEAERVEMGCFFLEKTVAGEISLDTPSLERLVASYLAGRVVAPIPQARYTYEVIELGDALEEADSNGQRAADIAVDAACAYREAQ